ncbi:hypothetical protein ACFFIS_01770 [Virgibacillus soli]|uniref:Spore coat-associated protein N n=1 Tax=Paracerasibacillus soli TaxID=480284 RepID=A0ABU5CWC5_9BACI|nr:hypothetical protein [Virgibacillus soli]MDY0410156.1 hypothetical protein [Virgibacillus soli]
MKKWKKVLLGTALAGTLTIGAGFGTYSWFTAETSATGTLVNGTFSLGEMGQLFDHEQFAPSQLLFSESQTVENTGDLDQILRATYTHQINKDIDINPYTVGYTAYKYKGKPDESVLEDQIYELEKLLEGITNPVAPSAVDPDVQVVMGILTDGNIHKLNGNNASETITLGDGDEFWQLASDEYIDIVFGVKLNENAGNDYQGVQYNAEFKVQAKQTDNGAQY